MPLVYGRRFHAESSFQREPAENKAQNTVALHQLQEEWWDPDQIPEEKIATNGVTNQWVHIRKSLSQ